MTVAMIALFAALAAGYCRRRPPAVPRAVERASRETELSVRAPTAHEDERTSDRAVPFSPGRTLERPSPPPPARPEDTPREPVAATSVASPPREQASPPAVPAPDASVAPASMPVEKEPVTRPSTAPLAVPPPPSTDVVRATTAAQSGESAQVEEPHPDPDDPDSDRQAPVFDSVRFDPPEVKDGGVAVVSVRATDDLSGVKLVSGTVRSPSGTAIVPFTARDDAGNGVFTAGIAIPSKAETGDWLVGTLQIGDAANNRLMLAFEKGTVPQGGTLRVVSAESDSTAPSVHDVSLDKGQINPGETNAIVVDVDDDRSGVASVTGAFQNPAKTAFIPFTCRSSGGSRWEAPVPVPANADCGEWTLKVLRVADNASNVAELAAGDPPIGSTGFAVTGSGACDSEPPVIDTMGFDPATVSNASATDIVLTVRVHDEGSGVAAVFGRIEGPAAANGQVPWIRFDCAPDPKDPEAAMTATISVPQYAARGIWKVIWIQVTDRSHNARPYYKNDPALAGGSFSVE